jgi:hypothetical protein
VEDLIVVLGTVAALLAWCSTVAWHVASRAEGRARTIERVLVARRKALQALASLLSRTR